MIYLDTASTTPLDPQVIDELKSLLEESYGNAASRTHSIGFDSKKIVDNSRFDIATLIGAKPEEIIFNSGATEGINTILKGLFEIHGNDKNEIIKNVLQNNLQCTSNPDGEKTFATNIFITSFKC